MIRIAALLILIPGLAAAQGVSGTYQIGGCAPDGIETRISIIGDRIEFIESICTLTNPVPVRDMGAATLFDAVCQGEGENWVFRILLMPAEGGGLILLRDGHANTYQRCN